MSDLELLRLARSLRNIDGSTEVGDLVDLCLAIRQPELLQRIESILKDVESCASVWVQCGSAPNAS